MIDYEQWFKEQELTPISFQETSDVEAERLCETGRIAPIVVMGRDWEGIIVAFISDADADRLRTHGCFYVYGNGRIAEANLNLPAAFPTFAALLAERQGS